MDVAVKKSTPFMLSSESSTDIETLQMGWALSKAHAGSIRFSRFLSGFTHHSKMPLHINFQLIKYRQMQFRICETDFGKVYSMILLTSTFVS